MWAMTSSKASEIPVGTQFSPQLVDLAEAAKIFVKHSGDVAKMQTNFFKPPVHKKRTSVPGERRVAMLPLEAAIRYGLLEKASYAATPLAKDLAQLPAAQVAERFARHVLLECGGLRVVEAAEQMAADGLPITGDALAEYLTSQGFRVTTHNTAINSMRMWLAEAGVFAKSGWDVDAVAKERVAGLPTDTIAALAGLDDGQLAFTLALCHVDPHGWYPAADVRALAEAQSGVRLARSSLPKEYLEPLKAAGLIEYTTGGTKGGKTSQIKTTGLFNKEVLEPFLATTIASLDATLTAYYRMRPEDVYAAMESTNAGVKGKFHPASRTHSRIHKSRAPKQAECSAQNHRQTREPASHLGLRSMRPGSRGIVRFQAIQRGGTHLLRASLVRPNRRKKPFLAQC
jgi:site-specific DNA-methyltransferase (cytosine-N4-specific)